MLNLMRTDQSKIEENSKFSKIENKQDDIYGNSLLTKILEKLPRG